MKPYFLSRDLGRVESPFLNRNSVGRTGVVQVDTGPFDLSPSTLSRGGGPIKRSRCLDSRHTEPTSRVGPVSEDPTPTTRRTRRKRGGRERRVDCHSQVWIPHPQRDVSEHLCGGKLISSPPLPPRGNFNCGESRDRLKV